MKLHYRTHEEVADRYNELCEMVLAEHAKTVNEILSGFSDQDLGVFVAAKTIMFGRDADKAIENAEYHLEDRDRAIKLFGNNTDEWGAGVSAPLI